LSIGISIGVGYRDRRPPGISGDKDRVNPIGLNANVLANLLPDARLEILDGVGHIPDIEAPDPVNQLFREFFR
jgi:pimeloyl-ACP methyl ester carboxylesterase